MSIGTLIVAVALATVVSSIVARMMRIRRQGRHIGCEGCASAAGSCACCPAARFEEALGKLDHDAVDGAFPPASKREEGATADRCKPA